MPTLTRESRTVLALVLTTALLLVGVGSPGAQVYAVVGPLAPGDPFWWGLMISLLTLAVCVGLLLLARGAARGATHGHTHGDTHGDTQGETHDVWHHLAVAATWLAAVLVVLAVLGFLAATQGDSPSYWG